MFVTYMYTTLPRAYHNKALGLGAFYDQKSKRRTTTIPRKEYAQAVQLTY